MKNLFILFLISLAALSYSCRKDSFITSSSAQLGTSEDSLYFDTLFTSTGSVTQQFKIYNQNDKKLNISSISIEGGSSSFFKINADGVAGPEVRNLEMEANDSLYVFVTVVIDPTAGNLPFIIEDSISIRYNGNSRKIKLSAWGQNANFLNAPLISSNTTWTNERPYVIIGGLLIDDNTTLTIEKGTQIFLHADAPLLVNGTLVANGEKYDSTRIVFQGDRLDPGYKDYPGSWPGIYFGEASRNNVLKYVTVKNAYQGIIAEHPSVNTNPKLLLQQCIIDNCYDAGIIGANSDIEAENCLISNCGKNIMLVRGGNYRFTHCTDVAISNSYIQHKQPVLSIADFMKNEDNIIIEDITAVFTNCIFWGENGAVENEVVTLREGNNVFNVDFRNCLWKNNSDPEGVTVSGMIPNQDPMFRNTNNREAAYDFRLNEGSPAINAGIPAGIMIDLDGNIRDVNPDAGAFETSF